MAEIINIFNIHQGVPISYGLEIEIQETGLLDFRNRVGLDVSVDGAQVGTVEIDISSNDVYKVEISDMIKTYMPSIKPDGITPYELFEIVEQDASKVTLKPYYRSKPIDGEWSTPTYGTTKELYAVRGIHSKYFTLNQTDPVLPVPDNIKSNMTVIEDQILYLYQALPKSSSIYTRMVGTANTYDQYGNHTHTYSYDLSSKPENNYTAVGSLRRATENVVRMEIEYELITYLRSGDYETDRKTVNSTVHFECSQKHDYAITLVYLDVDFMWKSIPFYLKNPNTFNREIQTLEGYDYSKFDYNLKVRRTMDLKSDYMSTKELDKYRTLGLASEFYIKYEDNTELVPVRLTSLNIPVYSGWNSPHSQIEISVELSELIPTA